MNTGRLQNILERGASSDLWRNTLLHIPSAYGRLVYLAALRDPNTGRYHHDGLAQVHGAVEADLALRTAHRQVFSEWICYDLEQQKTDFALYISRLAEPRRRVIDTLRQLKTYLTVVPMHLDAPAVQAFRCNFEVMMTLLTSESGLDAPGTAA